MNLNPAEWTTRAAAAARYGVSDRTIDRLAARGVVKRRKFPHRSPAVFLSVADLDAAFSEGNA